MGYRAPIRMGDRVALAPHLDLWMAGVRFGRVIDSRGVAGGGRAWLVWCSPTVRFWAEDGDLLGAV